MSILSRISIISFLIVLFAGSFYLLNTQMFNRKIVSPKAATLLHPAMAIDKFELTDTNGKVFTERSLLGHWTLLFFGYTECPDICPMTVGAVKQVWDLLPRGKDQARFIFTSINPKQDNTTTLKKYLNAFHGSFTGLTGDISELNKLMKPIGISVWQDREGDGSNIIGHSSTLMLINPHGRLQAIFSPPFNPIDVASDIDLIIKG